MALDKVLKIYDENGNPVDYDILASDVKFLPDGKDLPTKLTEMEDAIEDAAEGGGYTPPQGGIPKTDLAPSVQTSLGLADTALQPADKTQLQNAINSLQSALDTLIGSGNVQGAIDTFNEVKAFLDGIDTDDPTLANQLLALNNAISALQTALAGKISGIRANGASTTLPVDQNGIVELPPAGSTISPASAAPQMDGTANVGSSDKYAREDHRHPKDTSKQDVINDLATIRSGATAGATALQKSDVSVETQGDGTVDINVKDDTYTINLNHTHENMCKLVVCEESELPSTLDPATIYAQVDDAETPTEIQSLWIAGLEFVGGGGGEPDHTPKLTSPRNGATIDFDGQSTATIVVKGRNLTSNLSVAVTGDFTVTANGQSVSTIAAADVTDGASVSLLLTKGNDFVGGTIVIRSADLDEDVTLSITDSSSDIVALTGVKFTGTQWLETDYKANTKTEFILKCKLETNSSTGVIDNVNRKNWILGGNDAQGCYELYHISQGRNAPYNLVFSLNTLSSSNTLVSDSNNMLADPLIIQYSKTGGKLTAGNASTLVTAKTGNNTGNLRICCRLTNGEDICYSRFYMTIYEFTIIEDGVNVRHYIPMRRSGSPGLYDTVTGSFLTSKTNDPLVEVNS